MESPTHLCNSDPCAYPSGIGCAALPAMDTCEQDVHVVGLDPHAPNVAPLLNAPDAHAQAAPQDLLGATCSGKACSVPLVPDSLHLGAVFSSLLGSADTDELQYKGSARLAHLNGAAVAVVYDSGAKTSFVTNLTVDRIGLTVQIVPPVLITMANGTAIRTTTRCRARVRVVTSQSPTLTKYRMTKVNAYVLPVAPDAARTGIDLFLGEDWMYANKAKLDYTTVPFTVSLHADPLPDTWEHTVTTGKEVLNYVTSTLYEASTVPLLTDRQCKRLMRQKNVASSAFVVTVSPANSDGCSTSAPEPTDGSAVFPHVPPSLAKDVVADGVSEARVVTSSPLASVRLDPNLDASQVFQLSGHAVPLHGEVPSKAPVELLGLGDGPVNQEELSRLLHRYSHIFAEPTSMPPDRGLDSPVIPLVDGAVPMHVRGKRLSPSELAEVKKQVSDLLAKGYIQPSSSSWAAPVLFVPKPDGSFRMAIDYRKLNNLTVPNRWPLPHIDELLEQVRDASVFSLLDLRSGYHQIRLVPSDIPKTAFTTPVGLYAFTVLPFGLCNAPAVFSRYMAKVLAPLLGKSVIVYLDDILVFSKTPADHLMHLEQLFDLLAKNALFARGSKCVLNRTELKYLGHIVGHGTLKVDPAKVSAVNLWPTPMYPKELQSFLGLSNYFAKFIQGYSSLAAPLTSLVAKTAPKSGRKKGEPYTPET